MTRQDQIPLPQPAPFHPPRSMQEDRRSRCQLSVDPLGGCHRDDQTVQSGGGTACGVVDDRKMMRPRGEEGSEQVDRGGV